MGKKVKWVQDNLGITRSALRVYESKGLLPPNEKGGYRDYDEDDLHRLWTIKELQGLGYSLAEIGVMLESDEFDFHAAMAEKVRELEERQAELDVLVSYAKMVRMIGKLPSSEELGTVTFQQHHEKAMQQYSTKELPSGIEGFIDEMAKGPDSADTDKLLQSLHEFASEYKESPEDREYNASFIVYESDLVRRADRSASDQEVQMIVKLLFEAMKRHGKLRGDELTVHVFAEAMETAYESGDIGRLEKSRLGDQGCRFLVEAVKEFERIYGKRVEEG